MKEILSLIIEGVAKLIGVVFSKDFRSIQQQTTDRLMSLREKTHGNSDVDQALSGLIKQRILCEATTLDLPVRHNLVIMQICEEYGIRYKQIKDSISYIQIGNHSLSVRPLKIHEEMWNRCVSIFGVLLILFGQLTALWTQYIGLSKLVDPWKAFGLYLLWLAAWAGAGSCMMYTTWGYFVAKRIKRILESSVE